MASSETHRHHHSEGVRATRDMCIWCFELLCHKLGRNDLSRITSRRNTSRENLNYDSSGSTLCSSSASSGVGYEVHPYRTRNKSSAHKATTDRKRSSDTISLDVPAPPLVIRIHAERNVKAPLFVTWMRKSPSDEWTSADHAALSLRGCIGSLEPVPILDLAVYAEKAAFHDRRFSPIGKSEVDHLECRVSILHNFEACSTPYDWDVDIHGVTVNFSHGDTNREYQATFLPGVAKEHNMTYRGTLEELIRKAGYRGSVDEDFIKSLRVVRYQASKHRLTFIEFQEHVWGNN